MNKKQLLKLELIGKPWSFVLNRCKRFEGFKSYCEAGRRIDITLDGETVTVFDEAYNHYLVL